MKKSLIAGASVAALGMAVLPFSGALAAVQQFTDQVQLTIQRGCSFEVTDGTTPTPAVIALSDPRVFSDNTVTLGEVTILGGSDNTGASSTQNIAVACSSDGESGETWTISGRGGHYTDGDNDPETPDTFSASTTMAPSNNSNTPIASTTGKTAETSGATSYWSFRIDTDASSNFKTADTWYVIPSAETTVASATPDADTNVSFTPSYRVYVGTDQQADTYTGYVTYTLADTLSNS